MTAGVVLLAASARAREVCSTTEPVCVTEARDLRDAERAFGTLRVLGLPEPQHPLSRATLAIDAGGSGCVRETGIVRAVVDASLATTRSEPNVERALADVFTALGSPCTEPPPRTAAGWPAAGAQFLSWIDAKVGAGGPGRYLAGITTRLPYRDLFAVLRENTKDAFFAGSTFADAAAAYGLARFFPEELPHDWIIDWPTTPRALALPTPLAPLASAAIRVDGPKGDLRIEASWEQHAELRIAVCALDARGAVLSKAWVPTRPRIPEASFTFDAVPGAHSLLLVLTSVGDPFEPLAADQSFEPHGAVVTLAGR